MKCCLRRYILVHIYMPKIVGNGIVLFRCRNLLILCVCDANKSILTVLHVFYDLCHVFISYHYAEVVVTVWGPEVAISTVQHPLPVERTETISCSRYAPTTPHPSLALARKPPSQRRAFAKQARRQGHF